MSTVDLSKVILHTAYDSYKNVSKYSGSFNFSGFVGSGQQTIGSSVFTLSRPPTYSKLFVYAYEFGEAISGSPVQRWLSPNIPNSFQTATLCSTPYGDQYIQYGVYVTITGAVVQVKAEILQPYAAGVTLYARNVPFSFIDYTTAQS
jgi:hypothetical protein